MERIKTYNLSENLILNIADTIERDYIKKDKDISRLAFVFGGKRPALFLRKELSRRMKRSFFSPRFFSIDEFMEYCLLKKGIFSKVSDLEASFTVYNSAKRLDAAILKGRESFSSFLPWAKEIVSFIEQLDLEDINIESLKAVQENAAIGYDVPDNINNLLSTIISIRKAYHRTLQDKKSYSRGLVYLLACRHINDVVFAEFERIFFCGFFYLHKSEEEVFKKLYDSGKGALVFQGSQKEWSVLEKLSRRLTLPISPRQEQPSEPGLSLYAGFDTHSQACLVREIIRKTKKLDNTVIVLSQPDNIMPLLSEISGYACDFNVSIGYPLKRSSLYSLFENIFNAQNTRNGDEYYTKDYLKALANPLVKNLKILSTPSLTRILIHKIEEALAGIEKTSLGGSLFVTLSQISGSRELYDLVADSIKNTGFSVSCDELKEAVKQLHRLLFLSWENIRNFYDFSLSLNDFLKELAGRSMLKNYPLNLKIAEKMFALQEELSGVSFKEEPFPKEEIFKIFKNKLDNEVISFSGSPLRGLQILGLFETRSLNFENVILMDVNESVLPNLKVYEPLIPREVMISLGLNRLEKEEEIQRYQFKRLIAGAKEVSIVYQDSPDKEKSRFIEEIIWEKQKKLNSFDAFTVSRAAFKVKVLPKRLQIKKTGDIIEFLKRYEYSPSSINTYLHCPLRFYYQYVLGLREKENLLEEPEGADIGNFIHELFEEVFKKFVGGKPNIDDEFEKKFFSALDKKFAFEFERKLKSDSFLIKEMLIFRMKRFVDNEKTRPVRKILCLEKTFKQPLQLAGGTFNFKAVIDRIDQLPDLSFLILDYKTGNSDIMPQAGLEKIEACGSDRAALKNTVKSFQLPIYCRLVSESKGYNAADLNACLYYIKDLRYDFFVKKEEAANKGKIMEVFLKALDFLMQDILDTDQPFRADEENARLCRNCPFFYLCR